MVKAGELYPKLMVWSAAEVGGLYYYYALTWITLTVYTDDVLVYYSLSIQHESIKHLVAEYVRDQVHANSVLTVSNRFGLR